MRFLRIALRLPLVLAGTLAFFLLWLAGFCPSLWLSRRHLWRAFVFRTWARLTLAILGVRLTVDGEPPRPPFVLISNHVSYFDIPLLASQVDTVFVAKREVAGWPVIGTLCRAMGTLFIDRESRRDILRVSDSMSTALASGQGIVVFPEGTTSDGTSVGPFRPSLLEVPVRLQEPVHYVSLAYTTRAGDPPAATAICWWGDMTLAPHFVGLLGLRGFDARLSFGEECFTAPDRKLLAKRLRQAITHKLNHSNEYWELQCL